MKKKVYNIYFNQNFEMEIIDFFLFLGNESTTYENEKNPDGKFIRKVIIL